MITKNRGRVRTNVYVRVCVNLTWCKGVIRLVRQCAHPHYANIAIAVSVHACTFDPHMRLRTHTHQAECLVCSSSHWVHTCPAHAIKRTQRAVCVRDKLLSPPTV